MSEKSPQHFDLWEIPSNWEWTTTGEVCTVVGGGTPRTNDDSNFDGGEIPWITPADLSGYSHKVIERGARNITERGLNASGATMMPAGTVLFSSRAPIGYVAIAANPVCTNQGFKSFVPSSVVNADFLYYYLQFAKPIARELASGTTFLEISGAKAAQIPLPLAPLGDQVRIVAEIEKQFTRLDAAAAALKRVQANLKRYRASVLKAACEGRLVPTEAELARKEGRDYEPASELLKRILRERRARWEADTLAKMIAAGKPPKDDRWKQKYKEPSAPDTTNLPELPEGWCWTSLDQLAVSVRNGISAKPDLKQGLPILRISAVRAMSVNIDDVRFLPDDPQFYSYSLSEDDLLFVRYNGNPDLSGRCGRVGTITGVVVHPDKLIRVDVCYKQQLAPWIEVVSNFGHSRRHLELKTRTTAGQAGVSGADIREIPIPLCPLAEAVRVAAEVDRITSSEVAAQHEVERNQMRAASLRQSILRNAFTGQLVPHDPTDEPASALLERIRAERSAKPNRAAPRKHRELVHA